MPPPPQTAGATKPASTSGAIRGNAQAAITAGDGGSAKCDFCKRVGLPILPLRYAVEPNFVPGGPGNPVGWAKLGKNLVGQPAEGLKAHRYVLRTLRQGYVMVYLGAGLWHAYVVTASGHLRKLADIDDPDHKNDRELSPECTRAGHNTPASFITIPPVTRGGTRMLPTKVWIAFSDVLWSAKVRKTYEGRDHGGPSKRGMRFQSFTVDALGKTADAIDDAFQLGTDEAATGKRLNSLILEYAGDAAEARKRTSYDAIDPFDAKKRNHMPWQSVHGLAMRTGESATVAKYATTLTPSFRDKLMAAAVVLDDPVGMVQELNATRLMFVESRQRYLGDARIARPLLISQSIMGLKALIGEQTAKSVADEEAAKGLPDVQSTTYSFPDDLPSQSSSVTITTTRQERVAEKMTSLWSSLQKHYRESERAAFDKALVATVADFQKWLDGTDADYAHFFGQPDWVLRCRDFDSEVAEQQDKLREVMALCLRGGPTGTPAPAGTPAGQTPKDTRVYEVWKKFFNLPPTDEANPIYAALFGFDESILEYLLPDGPNPTEDHVHKGTKIYKVIKTLIGTKDLTSNTLSGVRANGVNGILTRSPTNTVPNPIRGVGADAMNAARTSRIAKSTGAIAESMLAMGGSLNRMVTDAVSEVGEATVMRSVQAAVLLYERREIHLVTSRIRVREYIAFLNNIAFDIGQAGTTMVAKGIRSVAQAGKATVRSMAIAGALRITDKKISEGFIDVMHWVYDDLDSITHDLDALPAQQAANRATRDASAAARVAENATMAAAMRVHPFSISPEAAVFVETVTARARTAGIGAAEMVTTMTRTSLRLVSTGSGLIAVGSLVIQAWSWKDNVKKASKTFLGNNEARVLVVSATMGAISAVGEVVGVGGKLMGATWGTVVGRSAGVLGAAASIVEGIQAYMAASRAGSHGDKDAQVLYGLASAALIGGGMVGMYAAATGAALLGPVGWALLLIAAGVALLYFAMMAEDSQAAIWLDRCYWGAGERFKNSQNEVERPWTAQQIDQELSHLNAIIIGLSGETGFNDDGWGFTSLIWDTVKAKLTFPGYDPAQSAYEWRLVALDKSGGRNVTLASGKHLTVPDDPDAVVVTGRAVPDNRDMLQYRRNVVGPTEKREGKNGDVLVIEVSAEVRTAYFKDVLLTAEYVTDLSDPRGRASLSLSESD